MRPEVLDYELLVKARDWLSDRKHWIKGRMFRGRKFNTTNNLDDLTATCAVGALVKAAGVLQVEKLHAYQLLQTEVKATTLSLSIEGYNDTVSTTHKGILGLFDRAIAKAKKLATAPLKR